MVVTKQLFEYQAYAADIMEDGKLVGIEIVDGF